MSNMLTDEQVRDLLESAAISAQNGAIVVGAHAIRKALQEAARLGADIEREACAKVCEEMQDGLNDYYDSGCYQCASAIRARAGKEGG